ncbi:hypothetical protein D3C76_1825710 [compost metagenome]
MALMLASPDAITKIVLQKQSVTLLKTAVKALFTLVDAQFQCRKLLVLKLHRPLKLRAKVLFDKLRAAT